MLVIGNAKVNYADKVMEVQKQALAFSNPQIPYNWEQKERIQGGFFAFLTSIFSINTET